MGKAKQVWLSVEKGDMIKMIAVKTLVEDKKDLTIQDLIESYKEFKIRLLIA